MKAIEVRSLRRPDGSRRVGRRFAAEPQFFAPGFFKQKELQAIDEDPQLSIREVDVDPKKVDVIGAKAAGKPEAKEPESWEGGGGKPTATKDASKKEAGGK